MDLASTSGLVVNGVTVNFATGTLKNAAGAEIPLRAQSFAVLRELASQNGRVVEKGDLIDAVWKGTAVTDDSLVQCVGDIRRAFGDTNHNLVKTVPRRGYRLALPEDVTPEATPKAQQQPALFVMILAGLIAVLSLVAWWQPARRPLAPPTVAVLPFEDLSADHGLGYLGKGVAEDVIAVLARTTEVMVISRNTAFQYGSHPGDIRRIGRELGADYVIEGSVRRNGDQLRVTAQISDAATGQGLGAERFDTAMPDPTSAHDGLSGRIVARLTGDGSRMRQAQYAAAWRRGMNGLTEYGYYLRGLDLFTGAAGKAENDRAGTVWAQGLARFPDSNLLRIKLGWYHWTSFWSGWSDDIAADIATAGQLAREVLASDRLTPELRREANWLNAFLLMQQRDFALATLQAKEAVELAPDDATMLDSLSEVLVCAGQYDTALDWLGHAATQEPDGLSLPGPWRGNEREWVDPLNEFVQGSQVPGRLPLRAALGLAGIDQPARGMARRAGDPATAVLETWRRANCHRGPGQVGFGSVYVAGEIGSR